MLLFCQFASPVGVVQMQLISILSAVLASYAFSVAEGVADEAHKSIKYANDHHKNRRALTNRDRVENYRRITAEGGNNGGPNRNGYGQEFLKSTGPLHYGNNLAPAPPLKEIEESISEVSSYSPPDEEEEEEKEGYENEQEERYDPITMVSATAGTTGAPVVEETTYATTTTTTTTNEYGINRLAAKYLKTAAEQYEGLDDLEIDYANEFLKKGLVLGADFEGGDRWDERFMSTLKRFYASLMQQAHPFIPDIAAKWRAYSGEKVHRSPRLYTKHKSIDCGNLSMKLKMTGIIYDGHRNRVIKLFDRGTRKTFAYKTYGNPDEFYVEQEKFLWLDNPYYVKAVCHRKDLDTGKAGILFEYVDGMGSMEYARNATPEQLKMISAQLFLAIEHLHWLGIVHADMKPENVLIRRDGTVQVIDLGFATHLPQSKRRRGTHTTMAPELHYLVPGRVHEAIDWWAYGSTVAMWYGINYLYKNDDGRRFIPMNWQDDQFIEGSVPWRFPQELRNFLQIFFQPDPNARRIHTKRLLKQVRNDPFFNGIDWSKLHGGIIN